MTTKSSTSISQARIFTLIGATAAVLLIATLGIGWGLIKVAHLIF